MPETKDMGKIALDHAFYYGAGAEMERLGLAELVERKGDKGRARPAVYRVKLPLPEKEALVKLALEKLYTRPLGEWYEDAKSDEESLRDEMTEWRDNMESNNMENVPKFEEVQQAAESMENQELPDAPEGLAAIPVTVSPGCLQVSARHRHKKERTGRGWRHSEALGILEAVKDKLRERIEKLQEKDEPTDAEAGGLEEAEDFLQEVEGYTDEVEGVDFPGMF
jgi:hypothetical protein